MAGAEEGLGGISLELGKAEQALEHHRRSEVLRERLLGPDHPSLRSSWINEAVDLRILGRPREALALIRRVLENYEKNPSGDEGYLRHRLAATLRDLGDFAGALEADQRALTIMESQRRPDEYPLSCPLLGIGQDLLGLGRPAEALAPLERALTLRRAHVIPPELGDVELALAQALKALGKDRERARQLGHDALEHYRHHAERYGGWYVKDVETAQTFVSAP
jgi:serine/threonine-protein kinase